MRRYYGHPGHFICGDRCRFHICTEVGSPRAKFRISTVGDYRPRSAKDTDPPTEVGSGRLYETMVFKLDADGEVADWGEVDGNGYQTAEDADAGHEKLVRKYEEK